MKSTCFFKFPKSARWDCKLILSVFCIGLFFCVFVSQALAGELQTAEAIRKSTITQSEQKIPVHLRGVVTFFDEELFWYFIQDDTAGIYLKFPASIGPPSLSPGQLVEVTGFCSPGEYAPVVVVDKVQVVGRAPLPEAKVVSYDQLASGVEDSQFIEITGVVRSARFAEGLKYYLIEISTGGGRLLVYVKSLPVKQIEELVDSTVRVRGVCATKFNHKRQLFDIRLLVPKSDDLEVMMPAPKDPFAIVSHPIGSLLQFAPQQTYGHRVKVTGTVIYYAPGETVFLQDGEQGVEVQTEERNPLQLGDRLEVIGFVSQGDYTPVLQDAISRKIASGKLPEPAVLTLDEVLKGNHDCRLIQVTARVLDRAQHGAERYLILQASNFIFNAYLKEGEDIFAGLGNGSLVAVTGVCQIDPGQWEAGEAWRAKSFRLEMRSADDVIVLQAPPWWTLNKVLWMAGAFGVTALTAFGWVAVLRRQVAERTRLLEIQIQERQRAERQREIEQERARVAHNLHDDLGAGLTEVNMLSSLVKSPAISTEEKQRYLDNLSETALRMVTSLDEIVWAVNPRNDTIASLTSYFGSYAQRLLDLAGITCGLDIAEEMPVHLLDPKFRQEIFFAFKEAITNVVRHARATQVWLRIFVSEHQLVLEVTDNGCGIDASERLAGSDGLINMNERLKTLGGVCEIKSDPKNGTTVRFSVPLLERPL